MGSVPLRVLAPKPVLPETLWGNAIAGNGAAQCVVVTVAAEFFVIRPASAGSDRIGGEVFNDR